MSNNSNKPIIAKDNFVLAHKNLVPGVQKLVLKQEQEDLMMGKVKEVDEWVEVAEGTASRVNSGFGAKMNHK